MTNETKSQWVRIPDLGTSGTVVVSEILVQKGQVIEKDEALMVLESDKASMDVVSDCAGVVVDIDVAVNDQVTSDQAVVSMKTQTSSAEKQIDEQGDQEASVIKLVVPDVGTDQVSISELLVSEGSQVAKEDTLLVFESDKASMEFLAPFSGAVVDWQVAVGDKVVTGQVMGHLSTLEQPSEQPKTPQPKPADVSKPVTSKPNPASMQLSESVDDGVYASPIVRRLARELGVSLSSIQGSGRFGRITKADVIQTLKGDRAQDAPVSLDKLGPYRQVSLTKIQALSAKHLTHCWQTIPHVTQHDDLAIGALESLRQQVKKDLKEQGIVLTPLVFLIKSLAEVIQINEKFRAAYLGDGQLAIREEVNIGVAVDTEHGLVVPVIRNVLSLNIHEIAAELTRLSMKAKRGTLSIKEMQGSIMTVSSLGAIGGRYFTPIINAPEVAILGVSKAYNNGVELKLPVSLSYDHRVIDGVYAINMLQQLNAHMQTWCQPASMGWMNREESNG